MQLTNADTAAQWLLNFDQIMCGSAADIVAWASIPILSLHVFQKLTLFGELDWNT
jgi:hypothetical protein